MLVGSELGVELLQLLFCLLFPFQQRPGLLQVGSVKPFGEPAISFGQKLTGCCPLALLLPQLAQAHGDPQLRGFCLLVTRHTKSLVKTGLGLPMVLGRAHQQ